jgi:polyhydroxybutyrate depolymerase
MAIETITVDGRARRFGLCLPSIQHEETPLVLALHGNRTSIDGRQRNNGPGLDERTSFGLQADHWGVAVAYPEAFTGSWADGRGVTTGDEQEVDDVVFLRAVVEWCAERHGTRPDHTVVAGMSNGACMAHRVALEASDLVAVFVAVAGAMPAALVEAQPTHAVSALLVNGTADALVPLEGGYSRRRGSDGELRGRILSLPQTAARWTALDRCDPATSATTEAPAGDDPDHFAVTRRTVGGGTGGTVVTTWTVHGMGHTWPGAPIQPEWLAIVGRTPRNFDAAEETCRFAVPLLASAEARRL